MSTFMKRPFFALLAGFLLFATACGGAQRRGPDYDFDGDAGQAMQLWFSGDEAKAEAAASEAGSSPQELFSRAEISYWRGDSERAFDTYSELVATAPGDDLARVAAARIFSMRGTVLKWDERVLETLADVDWTRPQPLTRLYLSMSGETATQRQWSRSDTTEPWDAAPVGFPNKWKTSPLLSPWRLTEFDQPYPGEDAPLADRYLTPLIAEDVPINTEISGVYVSQGTAAYPGFSRSGVYLLESWITLEGDAERDYWLFGHFVGQAEVSIDGKRVLRRDEGSYDSPKLMRKIRLTPGTHRIVVKLAYQRSYRDWFDLAFVPDGARAFDDTGLTSKLACSDERAIDGCWDGGVTGQIELVGEADKVANWETIWVAPEQMEKASDLALFLTMTNAYYSADDAVYEAAWDVLRQRRPDFAAGWALTSDWLQTLWQVPSRLRDARTLKALREASSHDPDSLRYLERLGSWLREKSGEREAKEFLERARDLAVVDGRVRDIGPLNAWASYLGSKGWNEESEEAWRAALEASPANCNAAASLMSDLHSRSIYPEPSELTEEHERCERLYDLWLSVRETEDAARLERKRRDALREPWDSGEQTSLSREFEQQGNLEGARKTLVDALERLPDSISLWNALADFQLAHETEEAAIATLEEAIERNGRRGWLVWKLARLGGTIPLEEVMPDGLAAAEAEVARGDVVAAGANDEAYFLVDFAARHYFPDMTSVTLTHTVVRVMTKDAIDRYGERTLPGGAMPLVVRTIKQDGTVRVPERTAGKDTLSMPGLAEGDFVEIAYLQYEGAGLPKSAIDGVRFYFRMNDISTRLSEYVILGEEAQFMLRNDAPKPEKIEVAGMKGVRFVARDNPRPRSEPRSVSGDEFLPWIQMYRSGMTIDEGEALRRNYRESIVDSLKRSSALLQQIDVWDEAARKAGKRGSKAWVEQLYYDVTGHVTEPSGGFSTDVGHALMTREGNPLLLLKATYDVLEIPNEIYVARTKFQPDEELPHGEFSRYSETILKVTVPETGESFWTSANSPDDMFGVITYAAVDRPAVCITCDEWTDTRTPPMESFPRTAQVTAIDAQLGSDGTLAGTAEIRLKGGLAAVFRGVLRSRTDDTTRAKFVDQIMSSLISSATVSNWEIVNEKDRRKDLVFVVDFMRPNFARQTGPGVRTVEERFFREPIASAYASLSERTTPLLVGSERHNDYSLTIDLPDGVEAQVLSQTGTREIESEFGDYTRTLNVDGGKLELATSIDLGIQRVPTTKYEAFQKWALAVEQSSAFLLTLR